MDRSTRHLCFVPCLLLLLVLGACATGGGTPRQRTAPAKQAGNRCSGYPAELNAGCAKLYSEGEHNWVLNQMNLGLDALQLGYRDVAIRAFDQALLGIETVYADSEQAAQARSLWREEGSKNFKGEPYERAMAYYYRGLLDLQDNDIDNARASFKGGSLQDAFAEDDQNRCDFALLIFLQGWCSQLLRDTELMNAAYEEVANLRRYFQKPDKNDNVLIIAELGNSPRKRTDGIGHAELKFFRGRNFLEEGVDVVIDEQTVEAYPLESIFWQASTRGARPIDAILDGQVRYKKQSYETGSALANNMTDTYGNVFAGSTAGHVANALGLIGGIMQLRAAKMMAKADARYWANLPDTVHIRTANLNPGPHTATFYFRDEEGNTIPELTKTVDFQVYSGQTNLVWVRSRPQIVSHKP